MLRSGNDSAPTLEGLITARAKMGSVWVQNLIRVPDLLQHTSDLPRPEWPHFHDCIEPTKIELALVLAFFQEVPIAILKEASWLLLEHQCAGVGCHQRSMVGVRLRPQPEVEAAFLEIARNYYDTALGTTTIRLTELLEYRTALLQLGLDCDVTYHHLEEAIYPFDTSEQALDRAAIDSPNLTALIGKRWHTATLCFLAPNSD